MITKVTEWSDALKERIARIPESTPNMELPYPFYSEDIFRKEGELLVRERILPKGWEYNDYSKLENLIEVEDTTVGERFWIATEKLFSHPCGVDRTGWYLGCQIRMRTCEALPDGRQIGSYHLAEVIEFRPKIFRKRHYIEALLRALPESKVDMYITRSIYNYDLI